MDTQAIVLTGGASRRMGQDKASVLIGGVPLAERLVRALQEAGYPVTVLGRVPVAGAMFQQDDADFRGPAYALSRCHPFAPLVLVLQCDLVRFDVRAASLMRELIGQRDAVVPVVDGVPQPLCALYRSEALAALASAVVAGDPRLMPWVRGLDWLPLGPEMLSAAGLDTRCVVGANTPGELRSLIDDAAG